MRLFRADIWDNDGGHWYYWGESKAQLQADLDRVVAKLRRQYIRYKLDRDRRLRPNRERDEPEARKEVQAGPIRAVNIPVDRRGLCRWLNRNCLDPSVPDGTKP